MADAEKIAIFVPGALASRSIFVAAETWAETHEYALVYYRFPGMDGLPLDHTVKIDEAADIIADFAARQDGTPIRILGYSTGGPIALLAADRIEGDVRVAAMSTAVEHAGGFATTARGATDLAAAALRAKSLNRSEIWYEYYRTLLFGRAGLERTGLSTSSRRIVEAQKPTIVLPETGNSTAHTEDLRSWTLPPDFDLDPSRARIFVGAEDPIFSTGQTLRFAEKLGGVDVAVYPRDGHLLFLTRPRVFDDILAFFEAP